jgi:LysR family carnitine catabolism transcriptional activator
MALIYISPVMNIDLRLLRTFLQIVEAGGFTAAARITGSSQPALSRTIRSLEEELGQRVFDRDTRNLALTAVGEELVSVSQRLLGEFDHSLGRLANLAEGKRGSVTVAAIPTLAATLVPNAIASFIETHVDVNILIKDGLTQDIIESVEEGTADIGLTIKPGEKKELSFRPLLSDNFVAVSHKKLGQKARELKWADLQHWPFIAFAPTSSIRMMTDAAFLQAGVVIEPRYQCNELTTLGGLLAAGLGITALPELAISHLPRAKCNVTPLRAPVMTRSLGVLYSSRRALSPPARAFLDHLVDWTQKHDLAR